MPSPLQMSDASGSTSFNPDICALQKEWDETSCPICMEHPHNAVLLICTSHDKGCRSYICDTSYRHSNCLDRFKKLKLFHDSDHQQSQPQPISEPVYGSPSARSSTMQVEGQAEESVNVEESQSKDSLRCPLCRGDVKGWEILKEARQYLDMKMRSCSRESCSFSGSYGELRRHARRVHPLTRPADVDPSRQRAWRHLEHQREYGDILSAIRSAMPSAVMLGDYAIDDNEDDDVLSLQEHELGGDTGPWWATLFLFHMMNRSFGSRDELGSDSRARRALRRSSANRYLWGENLLGLRYDRDDDDDIELMMPRRRRRSTRSRSSVERP